MNRSAFVAIVIIGLPLAGCGGGSLLSMQKPTVVQKSILKQFRVIDKDGDNKVSYAETTGWLTRLHNDNDKNKDGLLERQEIPAVLITSVRDAESIVSSYDQNADKRLSLAELEVHANVMFQQDHNADGFLNPGEIQTVISTPRPTTAKAVDLSDPNSSITK